MLVYWILHVCPTMEIPTSRHRIGVPLNPSENGLITIPPKKGQLTRRPDHGTCLVLGCPTSKLLKKTLAASYSCYSSVSTKDGDPIPRLAAGNTFSAENPGG